MSRTITLTTYDEPDWQLDVTTICNDIMSTWPGSHIDTDPTYLRDSPLRGTIIGEIHIDNTNVSFTLPRAKTGIRLDGYNVQLAAAILVWLMRYIPNFNMSVLLFDDYSVDRPLEVTPDMIESQIVSYLEDEERTTGTPLDDIEAKHIH